MPNATEQIAFQLADLLKNKTTLPVTQIIVEGMEAIERLTLEPGQSKKQILHDALADVLVLDMGDETYNGARDALRLLMEKDLVGNIVDAIAAASKGKFHLNKTQEVIEQTHEVVQKCIPLFSACFAALSKKKK
jgi:hypothetical protein